MQLTKPNFWNKWMKNGRRPARPVTRFKADKPMVLRNSVASSAKIASDTVCLPQMMEMLTCFKANEFDQTKCQNYVNAFESCYNQYVDKKEASKGNEDINNPVPGQTKLNRDQLNVLLQRWPQPK